MFAGVNSLLGEVVERPGAPFRAVLAAALIGAGAVIVLHLLAVLVRKPAARPQRPGWRWWEKLLYLALVAAVLVLAVTAFYPVLRGRSMLGWLLLAHMAGAGVFTVVLPLAALAWCAPSRLGAGREETTGRFHWLPRLMFWLLLLGGLGVLLTMLASMMPWFGTEGMERLLDLHRYCGLLAVVALALHVYGVLLQRAGLR